MSIYVKLSPCTLQYMSLILAQGSFCTIYCLIAAQHDSCQTFFSLAQCLKCLVQGCQTQREATVVADVLDETPATLPASPEVFNRVCCTILSRPWLSLFLMHLFLPYLFLTLNLSLYAFIWHSEPFGVYPPCGEFQRMPEGKYFFIKNLFFFLQLFVMSFFDYLN